MSRTSTRMRVGNIPTPVGKTARHACFNVRCEKHPHARGEDAFDNVHLAMQWETSPRPWGRLCVIRTAPPSSGNIPTPVGKTLFRFFVDKEKRKHPHARGEDYSGHQRRCRSGGNIPTPVGKTAIYQLFSNGNNYILWPFQFQIFKDSSKKLLFLLLSGIGRFFLEN